MTAEIIYKGSLRTEVTHLKSGTTIETDAPTDNHGKGERFSPTDLMATSLGLCMITVMGIKARDMNIELEGTKIGITKVMKADPRRVGEIKVEFHFPETFNLDEKTKTILERTGRTCPVALSLHPDIKQEISFNWK